MEKPIVIYTDHSINKLYATTLQGDQIHFYAT